MFRRARLAATLVALCAGTHACSDAAPRMHVTRGEVPLGSPVVVHLEDVQSAPRSGTLWLTLAPADAPESFVGERVVIDANAIHASVTPTAPGRWEVRLHDDFPRRPFHVVARAKIEVVSEVSTSATFVSE